MILKLIKNLNKGYLKLLSLNIIINYSILKGSK